MAPSHMAGGLGRGREPGMSWDDPPSVALGCIARYIDSPEPYLEFVKNARERGHEVDTLVLAVSRSLDLAAASELAETVRVEIVQVGQEDDLPADLAEVGADPEDIALVLDWSVLRDHGLVPYAAPRNAVVLRALLAGDDVLIFFDHNMRPVELAGDPMTPEGMWFRTVDFAGAHLDGIRGGALITTGAYSGYDAFPPVTLESLRDLLHGIGREEIYEVVARDDEDAGLHLAPETPPPSRPTHQAWGGNLALDLRRVEDLPAFYSGWNRLGEQVVLARGEDTLLGAAAVEAGVVPVDIGLRLFLDPHDTFPHRPALDHPVLIDRLYWNCLGWVARLPLLDRVRSNAGLLDWSLDDLQASRRLGLQTGAEELAAALSDQRFLDLPTFFDLVYLRAERAMETYRRVQEAWARVVEAVISAR